MNFLYRLYRWSQALNRIEEGVEPNGNEKVGLIAALWLRRWCFASKRSLAIPVLVAPLTTKPPNSSWPVRPSV